MFYRIRDVINRIKFNESCKKILSTDPVIPKQSDIRIVSMVCHRDITMYLVAIKSFLHYCNIGKVIVLNDGSLTNRDILLLKDHIQGIEIISINEISTGKCPKGGCWERLCLIGNLVEKYYVLQLDSDTVTLDKCPEVNECIDNNNSFTSMGSNSTLRIEKMVDAALQAKCSTGTGHQRDIERSFALYPCSETIKYVRGNAALAGFGKKIFQLG